MRAVIWLLVAVLTLTAQMRLTVRQLSSFIESSIRMGHDDRKVADYLKRVALKERLDARTVETLQGLGAGPRTVEVLRLLAESSKNLPAPEPAPAKAVAAPKPPPGKAEQEEVLAQASEYAQNYVKNLPNFICTQVTRRYVDPSGLEFWQRQDVITAKLSFFEQKEDYKVILVNSRPITTDNVNVGGATSWGEFGSMMKEIFDPASETQFSWERWATLRGRLMHVYAYRVRQAKSKVTVGTENISVVAGHRGLVYVDAESRTVARIRQEVTDLPPDFPIQQAWRELDYDLVDIGGGGQYMLPLKHTVRMRQGKFLNKNESEFRMYRKFGAETTITFDTPDELSEEKFQEKPPQ